MPLFHVAGVNIGLIGNVHGTKNIIIKDVDPALILTLIEKEKINIAFMVPAVILFLMQQPAIKTTNVKSIRQILYGASPIAEDVLRQAQDTFGCDFIQLYGLTETTGSATHLPPHAHDPKLGKLRSCGIANPGMEIRIVDEAGKVVAQGDVGEIQIKGPTLMKAYWNKAEATKESINADGWFASGDAGYFDADGYVYIHDRVKDMIVSGGENVYPAEVENALFGHPAVADAAVIGVPDERWGEAVRACVVLKPDASATAEEIIAFAKTRIAGFKVPKAVDFVEALPRNPSGKILRRELRAPFWAGRERMVN
tara:strand:- start:358 stop:1290 length:933 start_codon:yes stop_codon:yes gene_type:complete